MHDYFIYREKEWKGPYSIGQVRSMWQSGALTADTYFRQGASAEWQELSTIAHILDSEPIPPLSLPKNAPAKRSSNAALTLAIIATVLIVLIGFVVVGGPSPMDSPPPTVEEVRKELESFRAYRRERAARGLSTERADEQIGIRERQLRAIEKSIKSMGGPAGPPCRWTETDWVLARVLQDIHCRRKYLIIKEVEARGVEPAQTDTNPAI